MSFNNYELVAMDCEMVCGIRNGRFYNMLGRVSIVDEHYNILMDKYVKPQYYVHDYQTHVSGIQPGQMEYEGESFGRIRREVLNILRNRILVGHAINNDLAALNLKHPARLIRDTARYRRLAHIVSNGRTPSLKRLAKGILGIDIHKGEHDSVDDAIITMQIYENFRDEWEADIAYQFRGRN